MAKEPDRRQHLPEAAIFVLGLSLIAIGASRQRAAVVAGLIFVVIASLRMARSRRG